MCLPARESVDQVECLPASATWWLSPNRSFFDLARTMKSGQNQQLVPWTVNRKHYNNKKRSGETCFAKVEPAKCVILLGVNFENSLGKALILDIPVKKVYNQFQNASSVKCCAQIKTIKWNPLINVKV